MVNPWWSWGLSIVGLSMLWLMSTGRSWPWLAAAAGQAAWMCYGATTHQWGFVASGLAYGVVNLLGWRRVRRRVAAEAVAR